MRGDKYVAELRRLIQKNGLQNLDRIRLADHHGDCEQSMVAAEGLGVELVAYEAGR